MGRDNLALMISWAKTERDRPRLAELLEELQVRRGEEAARQAKLVALGEERDRLVVERAEAVRELARLRETVAELENTCYRLSGHWEGDELEGVALYSEEGGSTPPVELHLDATALVAEARRQQARSWCQAADTEQPPLEQLLALAPPDLGLVAWPSDDGYLADWRTKETLIRAMGDDPSRAGAIRAAIIDLLGLRRCSTCAHWDRRGEPEPGSEARTCLADPKRLPRHPESRCPDRWQLRLPEAEAVADTEPPPATKRSYPGVSVEGNVIRAAGDEEE